MNRPMPPSVEGAVPPAAVAGIVLAGFLALILRLACSGFVAGDYAFFIGPWYDHLQRAGIAGFGQPFANYNFPYLFLLYLSTLLPIEKIVAIQLIGITFDFVLAGALYLLVLEIGRTRLRAAACAVSALYLPTVVMNSSVWEQCDVIYVTFLVLGLLFVVRERMVLAWAMFGVALAFKLQAVFLTPVLAYAWMRGKGPWSAPLIAVPTFVALSLPPVLFGRPVASALGVYAAQYGSGAGPHVSAPNLYGLLPQAILVRPHLSELALGLACTTVGLLLAFCIRYVRFEPRNLMVVSGLFLLVAPFLLPQMHERYFYGFEILCLVIGALDPRRLWLVPASQFVACFTYAWYLFDLKIVPWQILVMIMLSLVLYFLWSIVQHSTFRSTIPIR